MKKYLISSLLAIVGGISITNQSSATDVSRSEKQLQRQPNILFILVDDMAFNDIGCYAYPGILAPGKIAPSPFPEHSAFAAPNQAVGYACFEVEGLKSIPIREVYLQIQ